MAAKDVKYNVGSVIPGTTQLANLAFVTGVTSNTETGFYGGVDDSDGYVIATDTYSMGWTSQANSLPTFWKCAQNDSALLALINQLPERDNNHFSDINLAKAWLSGTNKYVLLPFVVSSGLKIYLDAGNNSSYNGSGSSWYDLSGNSNNATLINTPTFDNTTNGGLFSFDDASFEYATIPNIGSLSTFTVETWCRIHKSLSGKVTAVVCNEFNLINNLNFSIGTNRAPGSYNMSFGYFNGAWRNVNGFSSSLNTWYHLVGTYDGSTLKFYVNNSLDTQLSYSGSPQSGGEIRIARRWDSSSSDSLNFFDGDVSIVRIYDRALNSSEITQNYNVDKSRFGY